jgi:hypothetical protein
VIEKRHTRLWIAFALSYARREKRIDLGELIRGQRDVKSTEIVIEITEALGAGDRDEVLSLSQHPSGAATIVVEDTGCSSRVLEPTKSVYLSQVFQAAFWII